ncbi:MAG: transposase [Deltaproteobacteria bacterium]|nr:transposase [Deltaproteobacteria bacterium]
MYQKRSVRTIIGYHRGSHSKCLLKAHVILVCKYRLKLLAGLGVFLWKEYGEYLKTRFWHEHTFWSDGCFACTTGDASTETIRKYIENQG